MAGYDWRMLGDAREAVVTVIGDHYGLYGRMLPPETTLVEDLGSDDIDKLEVLMTVEELFGLRFDEASRTAIRTVGDVITLVEGSIAARGNSSLAPASDKNQL